MVSDRTRRWLVLAGRVTGSLCVWGAVLVMLAWAAFGIGLPVLVCLIAVTVPDAERSPDYEGTFEMGAVLVALTTTLTAIPLVVVLFALGAGIGYLTPAPLYLGPLRRIGRAGRYAWSGARRRVLSGRSG